MSFVCDICNRQFNSKRGLSIHKNSHKENEAKIEGEFKCDLCDYSAKAKSALTKHKNSKHSSQNTDIPKDNILIQDDDIAQYCKFFYNKLRGLGKTNEKAKFILVELILLKKLESHLPDEPELKYYKFSNFAHPETFHVYNADVHDYVKNTIIYFRKSEKYARYFLTDNRGVYNGFNNSDLAEIINKLKNVNLDIKRDFIGDICEENQSKSSNKLGQFFTPTGLKEIALSDVVLKDNMKICDPCMGTAGFLIHFGEDAKKNNFKTELYGADFDENIYDMALLNLLIRLDLEADNFIRCDSLKEYDSCHEFFDIIISNPPYGIKNKDIPYKPAKIPFPNLEAEYLFIQLFIQILKAGGQCSIVVPISILTTKKTTNFRKYLIETCEIKKIYINYDGEIKNKLKKDAKFNNTSVNVCIIYFVKRKDPNLNMEEKIGFYSLNTLNLIKEINLKEVIEKDYSLKIVRYFKHDVLAENIKYLPLGEIYRKKEPKLVETNDFIYNEYGAGTIKATKIKKGQMEKLKTNKYNYEGFNCKIAIDCGGDNTVLLLNEKFLMVSSHAMIIESKLSNISNYYLFTYLFIKQDRLNKCFEMSGIIQTKNDMEMFNEIPIPIISMENQLDFKEKTYLLVSDIINYEKNLEFYQNILDKFLYGTFIEIQKNDKETVKIKDLIKYKTGNNKFVNEIEKSEKKTEKYKYRFYNSSSNSEFYVEKYEYKETYIILSRMVDFIINIDKKFQVSNSSNWILYSDKIDIRYLYLLLRINQIKIRPLYSGIIHKSLSKEEFENIEIDIPKDFDFKYNFDALISLEQDIKKLKKIKQTNRLLLERSLNTYF